MAVVKLTQDYIDNQLVCPEDVSRVETVDSLRTGLYIQTTKSSSSFYLRFKNANGKTSHERIGRTSDISLSEAREMVKKLKAEIALGNDPVSERQARRAVITLDEFFNEHYTKFAKPRKRSFKRDEQLYRIRIKPRFGHLRLNEITRHSIFTFQADLLAEGLAPASVNHHIKLLRRMFSISVDFEMLEKNVASKLPMLAEMNQKERYLSEEELARLVHVLKTDTCRTVGLIVLLLLSTGARVNEALCAKWCDIDRERRIWRIPATNSKSKRLRSVPLSDSAMDVLNQLDTEREFEYVFINRKTQKRYVNISKVWHKLRNKAGLPEMRLHDARHFFCGALASSGRTLYEIQVIAGHSDPKTTIRYSAVSSKALQSAASTASDLISKAMSQKLEGSLID